MTEYFVPKEGSLWRVKGQDDLVTIEQVKKRGRGYYVLTNLGRYRLKDFLRSMDFLQESTDAN